MSEFYNGEMSLTFVIVNTAYSVLEKTRVGNRFLLPTIPLFTDLSGLKHLFLFQSINPSSFAMT
ncbi:MAG TPA: hypothetical protein EYP59_13465 [Thiotrichaceae bacterium]|nr:hypothetical protein [Thiotrichaceae bacterium]